MKAFVAITTAAVRDWFADKAYIYAAALSYHTLLALAPLVIVAVGVIGLFYGSSAISELVKQAGIHLGEPTADAVQLVLDSMSQKTGTNIIVVIIGAVLTVFTAASAFRYMRRALNAMWNIELIPAGRNVRELGRRLMYQSMLAALVLALGVVIVAVVGLSALWTYISGKIAQEVPAAELVTRSADFIFTFGLTTVVFAVVFQIMPLAHIGQRYLWAGAALTAILFDIGRLGFGIYTSHSTTSSAYGAAGTLVIFLIWVYYSSMIVFFGAEFAQAYARSHGRQVQPRKGARRIARWPSSTSTPL